MGVQPNPAPARVAAIDAFRGFVMLLMMAEVLHFAKVADGLPKNERPWPFLAYHQTHVEWAGCSLHDLIQPAFSLLVGAALPFSLAARSARGQSTGGLLAHAAWRALILIALGIFLRSVAKPRTNFTFEDTLTQIGLGYLPLVLLALGPPKGWWAALVAILVGYWLAFALFPAPGPGFDYAAVGVPKDWPHLYSGFVAHWNKNSNLAWAFDTWFLNLFPRVEPFRFNGGGYATLSFVPTLGTMILGLIAGDWLKRGGPTWTTVGRLVAAGAVMLALGWLADAIGICPSVKRIWTPSWVLFSGGWCFLILAGFYAVLDVAGLRAWSYPLRVIGMNSIAAYVIAHLFREFIVGSFRTHLGKDAFRAWGPAYEPLLSGAAILLVYWLILAWMDRRRIYLRV
jgi:heparan-alpha-glucosaminide N-acetyltransferase